MKILITGASGMLGSDFSQALTGEELLGAARHPRPHVPIPFIPCDFANPSDTAKIFDSFRPQVTIHTAAMTQVDLCETEQAQAIRLNVDAVKNIVQSANEHDSLLIFFSTDYVFQGNGTSPYKESDVTAPHNFYGVTKRLAEEYILQHSKNYLIFRISWLFGLRGNSFPRSILDMSKKMTELRVVSDQQGCPTYSKDVAEGISKWLITNYKPGSTNLQSMYHLVNQGVTTWYEYAKLVLEIAKINEHRVIPISSTELYRLAKRPAYSVLSTDKVSRELGIVLRPWQEAVREFLEAHYEGELK